MLTTVNILLSYELCYLILVVNCHLAGNNFFFQSTSDSKLYNFTRLEPTLKLLEVPYDTNVVGTSVCK